MDIAWQVVVGVVIAVVVSGLTAWMGSLFTIAKLGIHIDYMSQWQKDHNGEHDRMEAETERTHQRFDDSLKYIHKRIDDALVKRSESA